jgi:hypothetical protein
VTTSMHTTLTKRAASLLTSLCPLACPIEWGYDDVGLVYAINHLFVDWSTLRTWCGTSCYQKSWNVLSSSTTMKFWFVLCTIRQPRVRGQTIPRPSEDEENDENFLLAMINWF